jgi:hypothetical protein
VEKVKDFVLVENELYFLEVPNFSPLVLLIENVITLQVKIWLISDLISRQ